ncbi:inheritance of peroxisomes protein 1-domain-containing protein [Xylaria sp. FL1042]|nr:inheritance of peroxisomes protein 1-domain-containing protein [Xylaria sp. FL1042]
MEFPVLASGRSDAPDRSEMPRPRRVATAPIFDSAPVPRPPSPTLSTLSACSSSVSQVPPVPAGAHAEELVETLYSHPSVRIISFTSSQRDFAKSFPARLDKDASPGTLPPSSQLERTIAAGAFRIYRAPGSVAFLSCGSALQPILPKSQCWCINEDNSRFVLQIRRPQYWRIEVPVDQPEDALRAELLRDVLDRILLFEKTHCPFQRSFTVDLPDPPETPIRKKAWTAEGKNLISSPFESDLSPPAHAPMAISRGERRTSIPLGLLPDWSESTVRDRARHRGQLSEHLESDVRMHGGLNGNLGLVRHHTLAIEERGHSVLLWEHTMGRPRPSSGNVAEDPTTISGIRDGVESGTRYCHEYQGFTGASDRATTEQLEAVITEMQQKFSMSNQKDNDTINPDHSSGNDNLASFEGSGRVAPVNLARKRVTRMLAGRSFSATPPASTPSKSTSTLPRGHHPSASVDSLHSGQPWHSSITPTQSRTPGVSSKNEGIEFTDLMSQESYSSEHATPPKNAVNTVTGSLVTSESCDSAERTPRPMRLKNKELENPTDSESLSGAPPLSTLDSEVQARRRSRSNSLSASHQALSTLPPAANFFTSTSRQTSQSRLAAVRRLSVTILQKTVDLLLGPPSHLIKLMLRVAAKIAAGEWRGLVLGFSESGEEIPVQWDYYSDDEFSDLSDSDDCTVANRSSNYSDSVPRTDVRRRTGWRCDNDNDSCEVD